MASRAVCSSDCRVHWRATWTSPGCFQFWPSQPSRRWQEARAREHRQGDALLRSRGGEELRTPTRSLTMSILAVWRLLWLACAIGYFSRWLVICSSQLVAEEHADVRTMPRIAVCVHQPILSAPVERLSWITHAPRPSPAPGCVRCRWSLVCGADGRSNKLQALDGRGSEQAFVCRRLDGGSRSKLRGGGSLALFFVSGQFLVEGAM